jgi:hypothetical protein
VAPGFELGSSVPEADAMPLNFQHCICTSFQDAKMGVEEVICSKFLRQSATLPFEAMPQLASCYLFYLLFSNKWLAPREPIRVTTFETCSIKVKTVLVYLGMCICMYVQL